jgi:hypothetical protein
VHHVGHVVLVRTKKQVRDAHATDIATITFMQNVEAVC